MYVACHYYADAEYKLYVLLLHAPIRCLDIEGKCKCHFLFSGRCLCRFISSLSQLVFSTVRVLSLDIAVFVSQGASSVAF